MALKEKIVEGFMKAHWVYLPIIFISLAYLISIIGSWWITNYMKVSFLIKSFSSGLMFPTLAILFPFFLFLKFKINTYQVISNFKKDKTVFSEKYKIRKSDGWDIDNNVFFQGNLYVKVSSCRLKPSF